VGAGDHFTVQLNKRGGHLNHCMRHCKASGVTDPVCLLAKMEDGESPTSLLTLRLSPCLLVRQFDASLL
jgi:hypothetical protein